MKNSCLMGWKVPLTPTQLSHKHHHHGGANPHSWAISMAVTMCLDFGKKNRIVALWKSLLNASVQKARNRPSTQLIEATSCIEKSNTRI